MRDDFPAAHSMDSAWFAVDEHGRVAIFETGEAGAMPETAVTLYDPGGDSDVWDEIQHLLEARGADPESIEDLSTEEGASPFIVYGNDDYETPGAYEREALPEDPVTESELSPELRAQLTRIPVDFTAREHLQLADYFLDAECAHWAMEAVDLRGEDLLTRAGDPRAGDADGIGDGPFRGAPRGPAEPARPSRALLIGLVLVGLVLLYLLLR
jgi:hypothetical protein